jgi:hypothetical protein
MDKMRQLAQRRAIVEAALVREDGDLKVSELARELSVSPDTIRRDVAYVRATWAATTPDVEIERARVLKEYEDIIADALDRSRAIFEENNQHSTGVSYQRLAVETRAKWVKLKGLDEPTPAKEAGEQTIVVEFQYPEGAAPLSLPAPGGHHPTPGALQDRGDGSAEWQDDAGRHTDGLPGAGVSG